MEMLPTTKAHPGRGPQTGFTMLEALVALLVLSIGLLGLAMLQVQGMRFNSDAYFRTQATLLAYDIIERMRANIKGVDDGEYIKAPPSGTVRDCDANTCSNAELAAYDLDRWNKALSKVLPLDSATITKSGNDYTIKIKWTEKDLPITQTWEVSL